MKESIGDYAYPAMMAEKALKDVHYAIINQKPEKAKEAVTELLIRAAELHRWVDVWVGQKQR
jgi:hypothetical protein